MKQETKNKRIRGEYPGSLSQGLDVSMLKKLLEQDPKRAEVLIYITMCRLNWAYSKRFAESPGHTRHDEILDRQWRNDEYALFYLARQLERFGVTLVYTKDGKSILTRNSDSYRKWAKFWYDYIESLDSATLEKLEDAVLDSEEDLTPYLPEKAWNEQ